MTLQDLIKQGLVTDPKSARGKLLRKAAHLFREKGYERTTVRDIAKAVGIQSGSIFHHFESKEDILKAVLVEVIHHNIARMEDALETNETAKDKIRALIRCELDSINGPTGEAMVVLVYEWRCLSDKNQKDILELRNSYDKIWIDALLLNDSEGNLSGDPLIIRLLLRGAINWTSTWYNPKGDLSLDELADEVLKLITHS